MWKLTEIYAQNICAFRELNYMIQQGVTTLIFGDNRDNESQRSNGSGKSALIECISIGITGSPLRKIKNEEIINDNSDEAMIELQFRNDACGETLVIERKLYRKEASVVACYLIHGEKSDPEPVAQHSVDAYNKFLLEKLGVTKDELYNNFILSKYKYQDFLSCSDKEKKEIINRFSNGNLVDKAIENIIADKIPIEELLKKRDLEFAGIEGRISILTEQIEKEKDEKDDRRKSNQEKIESLELSIANKRNLLREKAGELSLLDTELVRVEETDKQIQELENKECKLEDYLSGINHHLSLITFSSRMTDWNAVINDKKKRINEAEQELKIWDESFVIAEEKVNQATASHSGLLAEYEVFSKNSIDKAETYDGQLRRLEQKLIRVNSDLDSIRKNRRALSAAIDNLNNKLAGAITCPSCGFEFIVSDQNFDVEKGKIEVDEQGRKYITLTSKINDTEKEAEDVESEQAHIRDEKRNLSNQRQSWLSRLDESENNVKRASVEMEKTRMNQDNIIGTINQLNGEIEGILRQVFDEAFDLIDEAYKIIERKKGNVGEEINAAESSIDTLEKAIQEIGENSGSGLLESLEKSLLEYKEKASDTLLRKNKIEQELQLLQRQEQNFIEFKTFLANTKIEALSQITNEFLENIGSDIRIRFSGYTVLKSGKVREKISISLIRAGLDCGSFGKFSAGEAARVNLATILAMQKLINANCDVDKGLDLLVLDEIVEAVDEAGLAYMFAALNKLGITALIVSHGNIAESYPHTLKIIKENGESRLDE
ncbi:SMC family ATPase [Dysgonomonas sp. GY75]|uniref:SMC family ATPase n=1 Tax=Dysgonomonas sp. GY75 TaxID=2780419 RepID=UPI0018843FA6|nr:SMC family ATPase [Dysgonomonas sp. GY75]MBF0648609.1 SMC family ATPase [Dysgonomonas sp. GY75]